MVLKLGHFGQQISCAWKDLKCVTGEFIFKTAINTYNKQLGRLE
jgi:hypothetical protein